MISQFLINEPPLQVLPTLAQKIGLKEAIVLQQVHYWLNLDFSRHLFEDRYWVRYESQHWQRQFSFWDEKSIHRATTRLKKLRLLTSFVAEGTSVKYYTIDYGILDWVDSLPGMKLKTSSLPPLFEHANFDAINFDKAKGGN